MIKQALAAGLLLLVSAAAPFLSAAGAQTSLSVQIELIGRGIAGVSVTPVAPGVACAPPAGFAACLSFPAGTGGAAANTPVAILAPITVPKGQAITAITMTGQDAAKFAMSSGCSPYAAPCTLAIGPAALPVSPTDASGAPIPYQVTWTVTAP